MFAAFAFAWAFATLIHQIYQGHLFVFEPDVATLLTFVALFALFRPTSPPRFLALLGVQLLTFAEQMPRVVNHWLLMAVTSACILLVVAPRLVASRGRADLGGLFRPVVPTIRSQLILVYVFATLAKLNASFFDPALSCAGDHYRRLASTFPVLPEAPWAIESAVYGTLAIEAGLPLLLAIRRTRPVAILGGWAFHLALGWNGYYDFSGFAAAYYLCFAPASVFAGFERARARHAWLGAGTRAVADFARRPLVLPAAAALLLALQLGTPELLGRPSPRSSFVIGRVLWLPVWLALGAAFVLSLREGGVRFARHRMAAWPRAVLALSSAVLVLNGLSPYLGLKTENSFAMFSNLQTEGEQWNHWLVPRALRIFPFQDELVRILSSSDPLLDGLARRGSRIVPFTLRRRLSRRPHASVRYAVNGERRGVLEARNDPYVSRRPPALLEKLFLFREVPPPHRNFCLH